MTRIFVAGIFHETHSFSGEKTGLGGFAIHRGNEITGRRGDASQIDGFLSIAERQGWEVVPGVLYTGGASGTVDHAVFEQFWGEVKPALEKALALGLDGIHLSLHGAMVTDACDDPEGELMARIRALPGAERAQSLKEGRSGARWWLLCPPWRPLCAPRRSATRARRR